MIANGTSDLVNLIPLSQFTSSGVDINSFAASKLPDAVVSFEINKFSINFLLIK
jgi:hypothetical protein